MSSTLRSTNLAGRVLLREQLLELARLDEDELGARLVGPGLRRVGEVAPGEEDLGLWVLEVERHLAALEQDVHGDDDPAGPQDAVVRQREVRDVREHDADAIARFDAFALQQSSDTR